MKIVKLNLDYLNKILEENPNFNRGGIGLTLNIKNTYIFIPITSQKKYDINKLSYLDYPLFNIGDKRDYGTLVIKDYVYINHSVITDVAHDSRITDEIIFLKNNREIIEKKLLRRINKYKTNYDKNMKNILNYFITSKKENTKSNAKKFTTKLIQSMKILEKVNFSKDELDTILEYRVMNRVDMYDAHTILNIKTAWEEIIRTLDTDLTLDYIININKIIASHQALEVGKVRDQINYVNGIEISIPDKNKILSFINKVNYSILEGNNMNVENIAISLFYNLVTNQWFFDGNKRTGFAIMNKILIQNGIGVILITDKVEKDFSQKLFLCYMEKNEKTKKEFIDFIKEECYIKF
ncbi:Fic family protein [Fusobacterium sp.]|uniref:Fic family protein n=1 Tax=Fusobacterium sp. TaxID=68766 RepID=UPI0026086EDB|nr:Fic family protein [Fusobacterium sp.]